MIDLILVPIGTILPFAGTEPPDDRWLEIDGQSLMTADHPTLAYALRATPVTMEIWEGIGGSVDDDFIIMPPKLAFPEYPGAIVLMKVK